MKLLSIFGDMVVTFIMAIMTLIISFIYLCFNVFTIPLLIILWIMAKLIKRTPPHIGLYSLMLYPKWSYEKKPGFLKDSFMQYKNLMKDLHKKKQYKPIRAWEERFF